MGAFALGVSVGVALAIVAYLVGAMIKSIRDEKRRSGLRRTWPNFALSIAFCTLFFISWGAQAISEWQVFTDEQRTHGEPIEMGDFLAEFSQSTFENWQSEFLQLFSFVVMSALLIHRGSAESKDSDQQMQEALARIEQELGTKKG